jgi:hypothetical protein
MHKLLSLVILVVLLGVLAAGCTLVGSGPIVEKEYDYTGFTKIEISHDFQYDISQADNYSLTVSTHKNLVDSLDVSKSGHTLSIGFRPGAVAHSDARAIITLPDLEILEVSGASKGKVRGFNSGNDFNLQVSGASQADIDLEAGNTEIEISGASKVSGSLKAGETRINITGASHCDLEGVAERTRIEASGASGANLPDLLLQDTSVKLSGASNATINTTGKLDIEVSGASTLNYYGNPRMGNMDISGASQIHQK